jgi:hypothetical protein
MKNILLLLIFNFAFAKNGVAAVPSCSVLSGISMPKDSILITAEGEAIAKEKAFKSLRKARILSNIGILLTFIYAFSVDLVGFGQLNFSMSFSVIFMLLCSVASFVEIYRVASSRQLYLNLKENSKIRSRFAKAIIRSLFVNFINFGVYSDVFSSLQIFSNPSLLVLLVGACAVALFLYLDEDIFNVRNKIKS